MIIDATNLIVGRLAAFAAKKALLGEKVDIVNCEKAVITGNKKQILARFKEKRDMGTPFKGPFIHRMPDRILRRAVRGMLPYKRPRGKEAFKRVMCYVGVPEKLKNEKPETVPNVNVSKMKNLKYIKVEVVSRFLGAKI